MNRQLFVLSCFVMCAVCFRIPILFGGIDINKRPDGNVDVTVDQDAKVLGYGAGRNTTITFGNGTFLVSDNATVLTNGTTNGGATKFGFDKDGIVADGNLTVGNKTAQGGVGKEGNFIKDLVNMFRV